MAHSNWVNSSARQVYTKTKCRPYFDYKRTTYTQDVSAHLNLSVNNRGNIVDSDGNATTYNIKFWLSQNEEQNAVSRYLYISGDLYTNDYPTELTIKNNSKNIVYSISNNNKCELIIDFGKEISIQDEFILSISKWSRPNGNIKINKIDFNLEFEIQDMVKNYSFESGIPYDGKTRFSYGVISNTGSMTLLKDNKNYGYCYYYNESTKKEWSDAITNGYTYTDNATENDDVGVLIDGEKHYYLNLGPSNASGNFLYFSFPLMSTLSTNWSDMILYSYDIYNPYNKIVEVKPTLVFYDMDGKTHPLMFSNTVKLAPNSWNTISVLYNVIVTINVNRTYGSKSFIGLNVVTEGVDGSKTFDIKNLNVCNMPASDYLAIKDADGKDLPFSNSGGALLNKVHGVMFRSNKDKIVYTDRTNVHLSNRYETLLNSKYANILISVKTDGESKFNNICNMFVYNIEDDKNNISSSVSIADIFYIMNILKYTDTSTYGDRTTIGNYAYNAIVQFKKDFGIEIPNIEPEFNVNVYTDKDVSFNGEKFFTVMDEISKATNTFIVQNMTRDTVELTFLKKDTHSKEYNISYNDCYSVKDEQHINNNITLVSAQPCIIEDGNSNVVYVDSDYSYAEFQNYLDTDFNSTGLDIIDSSSLIAANPWIQMKNVSKTGTITIPRSSFSRFKSFSLVLQCATAYRSVSNRFGTVVVTVGEVADGTTTNSRLHDTSIPQERQYAFIGEETDPDTGTQKDVIKYTNDLSLIDDDNLTTVPTKFNMEITSATTDNITISYSLEYDYVRYFKTVLGNRMSEAENQYNSWLLTEGSFGTDIYLGFYRYEQFYFGAYKVALVGNNYNTTNTEVSVGASSDNFVNIPTSVLIQQGNTVDSTKGPSQAITLCEDIYNEYKNGKKIATINYIGSPFLKPYDIINLENGVSYRIALIKFTSSGGFKQQLTLIEKEQ